ncbi:MAG: polyphosphate kinase 1 [Verrucomicrobiales bacterium]
MPAPSEFINRELSWLEFNERVLAESAREELPLLERLKFLAITASNLDEFFMVRVGGLSALARARQRGKDPSGLTAPQQLRRIRQRVEHLLAAQSALLVGQLLPELRANGMGQLRLSELTPTQVRHVEEYFGDTIFPVLTPVSVDFQELARPQLPGLRLAVACAVAAPGEPVRHAIVVLPGSLPRFIPLPDVADEGWACVALEDVLTHYLGAFFPGEEVRASGLFRVTRNGDIPVDDDEVLDLVQEMEEMIDARQEGDTVRLEVPAGLSPSLLQFLRQLTGAGAETIYPVNGPLDLGAYMAWTRVPGFEYLLPETWTPQTPAGLDPAKPLLDVLEEGDILLHHPYESFDPVVRFVQEAAEDPQVLAIKQFLYRTGSRSRIVAALIEAAERGKAVTVLVELKARFDEERNLERAEELRAAGAQIIYGVRGLKSHAKVCLVVRQKNGRVRRYAHFGTGNYNEATARLYTDISFLTAREDLCADVSAFFNAVTARTRYLRLHRLAAAPLTLRDQITELINAEASRAQEGFPARIHLRINNLQDPDLIQALYRASQAGVEVRLNVRGVCCLRPGVEGLSDRIRVISIVDRFLEHSRILYFHNGGAPRLFVSSADWMTRNLDKRVELLVPIDDKEAKARLIGILKIAFKDTTSAWELRPDGTYTRVKSGGKKDTLRSQEYFYREARRQAPRRRARSADGFEPHRPVD